MYRADKLYDEMMEIDKKLKEMVVDDEASMAEYFKLYTSLIYDYKWIGSVYDIYSDDTKLYRENGLLLDGAHAVMKDTLRFTAAFPDLQVDLRDIFAVKKSEEEYKLWRYYAMSGTNRSDSIYGRPTNKPLSADACIAMSMSTVHKISGRWQIVREFTMFSADVIREACTP